jgi:hypothetical protein
MPTIDVPITVSAEKATKFRSWFTRYNATISTPFADEVAFFQSICMSQVDTAVRQQDTADDLLERWKNFTDDQRTRIRAIANE